VDYYKRVQQTMGAGKAAGFVRVYMVPGMEHCNGGPGPSALGQFGLAPAKGPQFGIFDSLEDWVEKGAPVENVFATKYAPAPDGKIKPVMTRPLCAYPAIAKYKGAGDTNQADNFECTQP
jgi:feruloyl esterase